MVNDSKYSLKLLSNVHEAIFNSFDYDFSLRQLALLITRQSKEIKEALETTNGDDGISIDNFINDIAKKITGQDFPLNGATDTQRHKFFLKFNLRKKIYFEIIEKIKS